MSQKWEREIVEKGCFRSNFGNNLYQFWGSKLTDSLNAQLKKQKSSALVNLASKEYFKAVQPKSINADIVTPNFKDFKNGDYKIISFFAKRARGMMVRYAIDHKITEPEDLKNFDYGGYKFSEKLSEEKDWIFTRK